MIYTLTLNPALDREMTVPDIALDCVLRATAVRTDYGGKGFNVSRALLALGVESTALGFVGGEVGKQLSQGLSRLGIPTDFIQINGETRTNLSIVTENHAHYFKVNEPGPLVTGPEAAALLEKVGSIIGAGDWCILAGSSPPGIQPTYIADVITQVQNAGAYAVLDMEGEPLRLGCAAGAFLVKPNAIEASVLTGKQITAPTSAIRALNIIHQVGAQQVVISLGKSGAVYSDGRQIWRAEPPHIAEHNPIGAGDAMLAGLVWCLQRNLTGGDALRWGVACGAAAASLDGTAVGSRTYVESLVEQVQVETEINP
jgi:1-phosphofructokinase family hexose kinase